MKRNVYLFVAMVISGGALGAAVAGCEVIAAPDRSKLPRSTTSGTGGTSSSTASTGGSDGGGTCDAGAMACREAAECPTPAECFVATCNGSCCGTSPAPMGIGCADGGKVCDGTGTCVACLADTDCPTPPTVCQQPACNTTAHTCGTTATAKGTACHENGGVVCDGNGACVAKHCMDGVLDADETDVDCGGPSCTPCADTLKCKKGSDCVDRVCGGMTAACTTGCTCNAPTCTDGVQNGMETDTDCGGPACDGQGDTCANGLGCSVDADCTGAGSCSGTVFTFPATCSGGICEFFGDQTDCFFSSDVCNADAGCVSCNQPSDCPDTGNECIVAVCNPDGSCGTSFLGNAHVLSTGQTTGDCQQIVCDGAGGTQSINDPTDLPPPSGTVCATTPACTGSPTLAPSYTFAATGTNCTADNNPPNQVCGDTTDSTVAGKCVQCNTSTDCNPDGGVGDAGGTGGSGTGGLNCVSHVCQ